MTWEREREMAQVMFPETAAIKKIAKSLVEDTVILQISNLDLYHMPGRI